jgi:hypothetical protein
MTAANKVMLHGETVLSRTCVDLGRKQWECGRKRDYWIFTCRLKFTDRVTQNLPCKH